MARNDAGNNTVYSVISIGLFLSCTYSITPEVSQVKPEGTEIIKVIMILCQFLKRGSDIWPDSDLLVKYGHILQFRKRLEDHK